MSRTRVRALATYPVAAACTRFRIVQFIEPLRELGIDLELSSFLDDTLFSSLYTPQRLWKHLPRLAIRTAQRTLEAFLADANLVFVQREAMLFGPPVVEWLIARRMPMILDIDDPTWMPFDSPVYGRLATLLKFPSKTNQLIDWADCVTCGSPNIAAYAESRGAKAMLIPTVVDTKKFAPRCGPHAGIPTIGWIGTHTTYPFLRSLFPVFERLAREHRFRLLIVGSGESRIDIAGVEVISRLWHLDREIDDFQSIDIGVYPLVTDEWTRYKSGFKAVQYMAAGIPFVMTPEGVCATMGIEGTTHFAATTPDEWYEALRRLLTDATLRSAAGAAGRTHAVENYDLQRAARVLASVIGAVTGRSGEIQNARSSGFSVGNPKD